MKRRKTTKVIKKMGFGILAMFALLCVLLIIVAIATEKKYKLREIDMSDGITDLSYEENYRKSFLEGVAFGNLNYEVSSSDLPRAKTQRFNDLSDLMSENFSVSSQRRVYEYAAQILEKDLDFYYHDNQDKTAYMEGFLATSSFFVSEAFSANGYIDKELAEEVKKAYIELLADPSEELFKKYLEKVSEEMQPPSPSI